MTVKAMVHSVQDLREVEIVRQLSNNDVVAKYNGVYCTAIFNPYTCLYYVDDIYGRIPESKLGYYGIVND